MNLQIRLKETLFPKKVTQMRSFFLRYTKKGHQASLLIKKDLHSTV